MPASPARTAALDILLSVESHDAYASELLHSQRLEKLTPQDRGLCTELVMGVLRWRSRLDEVLASVSSQRLAKLDAEVLEALRLAAYRRHSQNSENGARPLTAQSALPLASSADSQSSTLSTQKTRISIGKATRSGSP